MEDTLKDGRIDIVIFANGGREVIGREDAEPPVSDADLLPEVAKFVAEHQDLPAPEKFTAIYRVENGKLKLFWGEYKGLLPYQLEEQDDVAMVMSMAYMRQNSLDIQRQMAAQAHAQRQTQEEATPAAEQTIDITPPQQPEDAVPSAGPETFFNGRRRR